MINMILALALLLCFSASSAVSIPRDISTLDVESKHIGPRFDRPPVNGDGPQDNGDRPQPNGINGRPQPNGVSHPVMSEEQYREIVGNEARYAVQPPTQRGETQPREGVDGYTEEDESRNVYLGDTGGPVGGIPADLQGWQSTNGERPTQEILAYNRYNPADLSQRDQRRQAAELALQRMGITPMGQDLGDHTQLQSFISRQSLEARTNFARLADNPNAQLTTVRYYPNSNIPMPPDNTDRTQGSPRSPGPNEGGFTIEKRAEPLGVITIAEGAGNGNNTFNLQNDFDQYLNAFYTAQGNISNALFPIFDEILVGTNNGLIYDLVWSIYTDLTLMGPYIIGPFSYGRHSFDWIEDKYISPNFTIDVNTTSHNSSDIDILVMLATHHFLIDMYTAAWQNCTTAANKTSLLTDLSTLALYLSPKDESIINPAWRNPQVDFNDTYFTVYNETKGGSPRT